MEEFYTEHHKVSIITVCLNSERFLEGAIKSVLEQTYPNIEYIIIDGGSTDNSVKLFDKYKARIDKLITEKDNGIFNAMNKGLKSATGEIVYFLNSDDRFYNDRVVEDIVEAFMKNAEADFIYGNVAVFDPVTKISYIETYSRRVSKWSFINKSITQQATFLRSRCFEKVGYFDDSYKSASDYEWFEKALFVKGLKGMHIESVLAIFRTGGITTDERYKELCLNEIRSIQKKYFNVLQMILINFLYSIKRLFGKRCYNYLHYLNIRLKKESKDVPIKKKLRICVSSLIYKIRKFRRASVNSGFRVLLYHSIIDSMIKNEWGEQTAPKDLFDTQMKYLFDNEYAVISCMDAIGYLTDRNNIPEKAVVITFDDGYADNYTNALPILEKYNFPATIFITVDFLREYSNNKNMLSCSDLREMGKTGIIDFGCHGLTHRLLSLLSKEELEKEIKSAKEKIEGIINAEIQLFAYPFGHSKSYDRLTTEMIEAAGFKGALTTVFGFNNLKVNPFILKRNRISWFDNLYEFEKHLKGAYDWYALLQYLGHKHA